MSDEDAVSALTEAVRTWFETTGTVGATVMRSFYIIAEGVGFDDDGEETTYFQQWWDANAVQQLALTHYAHERTKRRMFDEGDD